jgi:hypothetical protein
LTRGITDNDGILEGVRKDREANMKSKREMGGAARWILASGLAGLLLMTPMAQAGARNVGAKVEVMMRQGPDRIKGELVGVRSDALVIETGDGAGRTIEMKDISKIRVYRKSQALMGVVLGAVAGGGVGYLSSNAQYGDQFLGGISVSVYTVVGVALGGLVGGITGALMGAGDTYDLTSMPAAEVDKLMAHLCKKARVPDYH